MEIVKRITIEEEPSKMEKIKDYIKTCPLLAENGKLNLNYLEDDIDNYSLDQTPSNPILQSFSDGGSKRQITFDFTIRAPFSALENIQNSKFCEDFMEWIEKQNSLGILPKINEIEKIKCTSSGYILQVSEAIAVYIIQMQVVYYHEAI